MRLGSHAKKAIGLNISVSHFKYPPITSLSSSSTRSKDWEDVITAHADDAVVHTWRVQDKRVGPWAFEMEDGVAQVSFQYSCMRDG